MLAVGDAMTIATQTDALLLVVDVNAVRRATLAEMRRVLDACPALTLGLVATGCNGADHREYRRNGDRRQGPPMHDELATAVRRDAPERSALPEVATAGRPHARQRAATLGLLAMSDTLALVSGVPRDGVVVSTSAGARGSAPAGSALLGVLLPIWLVGAGLWRPVRAGGRAPDRTPPSASWSASVS